VDKSQQLRTLRERNGYNVRQASTLMDVGERTWRRWESGERTPPESVLEQFCDRLGIDYNEQFR